MQNLEQISRDVYMEAVVNVKRTAMDMWLAAEQSRQLTECAKASREKIKVSIEDNVDASMDNREALDAARWAVTRAKLVLADIRQLMAKADEALRTAEAAEAALKKS